MASPLSADRALALLKAEGLTVREVGKWKTRNRNHAGSWGGVNGVMLHHTVTSGVAATVALCRDGHSDLPGPLCHGVIDKSGVVHMVGWGRTNHAGKGDPDVLAAVIAERPLPTRRSNVVDGNVMFYGFECINLGDGKDPWPHAQVEAMVRASAALLRGHGWGRAGDTSVIGHLEWQVGKVDPRRAPGGADVSMRVIRTRVAERLRHAASWAGKQDGYTVRDGDTLSDIATAHGTTWQKLAAINGLSSPDTIWPGQQLLIG